RPAVDGAADQQVAAGCAAELQERRDATRAGAAVTSVARDVGRAVPQTEADPESLTPLRVLRPGHGCRDAEQARCREDARCRTHRTPSVGMTPRPRRFPCLVRAAGPRCRAVLFRGRQGAKATRAEWCRRQSTIGA